MNWVGNAFTQYNLYLLTFTPRYTIVTKWKRQGGQISNNIWHHCWSNVSFVLKPCFCQHIQIDLTNGFVLIYYIYGCSRFFQT